MKEAKMLDRREFTLAAAMAVLSGVAITVAASCGGGSSSPASPTSPAASGGDKSGSISANHGHVSTITSAQIAAAGGITLAIQGTSSHPHTVTLAASEVSAIAGNQRVSKESSNDSGHSHTVTFN
jgi:spore coat protein U-like protein